MMEVTSGNYVIKETDLTDNDDMLLNIKETNLTEWDEHDILRKINSEYSTCDENSSQASFNDICDEFSRFLNQDFDNSNIKETSLTDDDSCIKETDLCNGIFEKLENMSMEHCVRETDLTSFDNVTTTDLEDLTKTRLYSEQEEVKETDLTGSVNELHDGDNLINRDNSFNDRDNSLSDRDNEQNEETLINDALILSYDGDSVSFQDIETDFFETDCENNGDELYENKLDKHNENIKFQDIESDYFETDCETTEQTTINPHVKSHSNSYNNEINPKDATRETERNKKPVRRQLFESRTEALSNTLLRSTINELEKALNDSNILLAKRDQKIQELRSENLELKKNLNKEIDTTSKTKLGFLEKDALLSERELKIAELQRELEVVNKQLSDFRMYELNNYRDTNSSIDLDCNHGRNIYSRKSSKSSNENEFDRVLTRKSSTSSDNDSIKTPSNCPYKNQREQYKTPPICQQNTRNATNDCRGQSIPIDDRVSKTELHSNLRMRFMRDAFFYYMIGFHPDEQINAILAILDYGDRRQDFVIEAHKLKKQGKKFNVTKVSSRGLTFVQQQMDA